MNSRNLADLVKALVAIRDTTDMEDRHRKWEALSAVIRYMESMPLTGHDPSLLTPLRQLCASLAPDLGSGRGGVDTYTMKSAALGVVRVLVGTGIPVGEARAEVAEVMTNAGEPTSARKVRSWTEGARADQYRDVAAGTAEGLQAMCPDPDHLAKFAKDWLQGIVIAYR